jgi:hypothetical protein
MNFYLASPTSHIVKDVEIDEVFPPIAVLHQDAQRLGVERMYVR